MDNQIIETAGQFIMTHYAWRHVIIAVGILLQGEITMLLSMYLVVTGHLTIGSFLFAAGMSVFVYENFFYFLGRYFNDSRFGRFIERKIPHYARVEFHVNKNATLLLILSRFVAYMNIAMLTLSGWTKMSWVKFSKTRLIANALWLGGNSIVYFLIASGFIVLQGVDLFRNLQIVVVVIILIIIFGTKHFLKSFIKKEAAAEETAEKIGGQIIK
ncbi:MAG: hypothetical protein V2A55_01125 [Candidatus Jorgensenbacteria bacterium]